MRQIISTGLVLVIAQVALGQEAVDEGAEEPVATSREVYDVQLLATSAEGDSKGLMSFESSGEHVCMDTGEFEFTESSESYAGTWLGFSWGPLIYRFCGAASEAGDNLIVSSLAFDEVFIGRAFTFGADTYEHYFVFGMMTDDSATPEDGDPLSEGVDGELPADDIPVEVIPAEEATDEE